MSKKRHEPGGLENEKTHIILQFHTPDYLHSGDWIEAKNVEPIGALL